MATYAVQGPTHAGATVTTQAPGGTAGDLCPTGQGVALLVNNANATAAVTVVLPVGPTYDNLPVQSRTVIVPAASIGLIPTPSSVYGASPTSVTYVSIPTSVTVAAITIP